MAASSTCSRTTRLGGNSYGCHENYLTSRREDSPTTPGADPVLVSRQIYARRGQGPADRPGCDVLHRPAGGAHLGGGVLGHHPSRPIINTRDEPHADAERYRRSRDRRRLEHDEYTTFLKVGTTSILLRMLEDPCCAAGHDAREPDPGHPRDQPDLTCKPPCGWPTGGRPRRFSTSNEYLSAPSATRRRGPVAARRRRSHVEYSSPARIRPDDARSRDRRVIKHKLMSVLRKHDLALSHPKCADRPAVHDVTATVALLPAAEP